MMLLNQWPPSVRQYLAETFGKPVFIKKLNGIKADGGCYRAEFPDISVIVKEMAKPQEYIFYNECSKFIQESGIHIPILYWSYKHEETYWIVIEDVPNPLPKERWYADTDVLELLFYFHYKTWGKSLPIKNHYIPKWDDELTDIVLKLFPDKIGNQLQPLLFEAQKQAQQLFKPYCWINADTNPTNWGIRKDGTVVLFDWERISCGSPVIDLAITIPGLGTLDNSIELSVLGKYLEIWSELSNAFPFTEQKLLQQIKLAKLWSVVEFLCENSSALEHESLQDILTKLTERLYKLVEEF